MKELGYIALGLTSAFAQEYNLYNENWDYNYLSQGADWPELKSKDGVEQNFCGGDGQSPINLLEPIGSYGWAYGETVPKEKDSTQATFSDITKEAYMMWDSHSLGMQLDETDRAQNSFTSNLGQELY